MSKHAWIGALLLTVCATMAFASDPRETTTAQEPHGALDRARTVAYLPFKGIVCTVGALASLPIYWLSGLDQQIKEDTDATRAEYCSQRYLLSPEWSK